MYLFTNSVLLFASKHGLSDQDTQASAHKPIDFWMKRPFEEKTYQNLWNWNWKLCNVLDVSTSYGVVTRHADVMECISDLRDGVFLVYRAKYQ